MSWRRAPRSRRSIRCAARRPAFRGDFLEGLDLTGCYRYHEWWIAERERVRATRVSVLGQLIERVRDTPDEALDYARQLLALDPLSEASHIRLIRLLGDMGRTREAIAQYDRCKRVLASELGAQPSPELQLARTKLSGSRSTEDRRKHPRAPGAREPRRAIRPPSTQAIDARRARSPRGSRRESSPRCASWCVRRHQGAEHGVLEIVGEPGIGKTRAHGGALAAGRGRWRRRARGTRLRGGDGSTVWRLDRRAAIGRRFPSSRARSGPICFRCFPSSIRRLRSPGDRNRLFDAVTRLLYEPRSAPAVPCVVILDDVQWFDEASAALLHFAARELSRSRVLFACGARPAELADNPVALRLLRSLAREHRLTEIVLSPMDKAETMELVRAVSQRRRSRARLQRKRRQPVLRHRDRARARRRRASLSKTLEQLIGDRFDRLEVQTVALLGWTAALGRSFRSDLVEQVVPFPRHRSLGRHRRARKAWHLAQRPFGRWAATLRLLARPHSTGGVPQDVGAAPAPAAPGDRARPLASPRQGRRSCAPTWPITPRSAATTSSACALASPRASAAFASSPTPKRKLSPTAAGSASTASIATGPHSAAHDALAPQRRIGHLAHVRTRARKRALAHGRRGAVGGARRRSRQRLGAALRDARRGRQLRARPGLDRDVRARHRAMPIRKRGSARWRARADAWCRSSASFPRPRRCSKRRCSFRLP